MLFEQASLILRYGRGRQALMRLRGAQAAISLAAPGSGPIPSFMTTGRAAASRQFH